MEAGKAERAPGSRENLGRMQIAQRSLRRLHLTWHGSPKETCLGAPREKGLREKERDSL